MGEAQHHLKFRVAEGGSSGELLIVACAERSARVFLRISVVWRALGLCARLTSTGGNADEGEDQGVRMPDQISIWRVIWEGLHATAFCNGPGRSERIASRGLDPHPWRSGFPDHRFGFVCR